MNGLNLATELDVSQPPSPAEAAFENEPYAGVGSAANRAGVWRALAALIGVHSAETALLLGSWVCVGSGALSGRLDYGWLAAWALALLSMVPLHALSTWLQGVVAVGFGGLLKERMLDAAILTDHSRRDAKGSGRRLSEALDTVALDDLATNGGMASMLASIELLVAPVLMYWGGNSLLEFLILAGWDVLTIALIGHNLRLRSEWTQQRLALSERLIDRMSAQRTREAQQSPERWHGGEDIAVERYLRISKSLDESTARIETALPRTYLIVSFLALAPGFVSGTSPAEQLAVAVGVILFAKTAFERLCFGFSRPATAWIAWQSARPAADVKATPPSERALPTAAPGTAVLQVRDLAYSGSERSQSILAKCSLTVKSGEQVLLEGPSGCGKSMLAHLLAGVIAPSSGHVLAGGLERLMLGDNQWRHRVALVPHDHANHLFSASLAFNLLLSRPSPTMQDERDADALCRELGLENLLERMPQGLQQLVGEGGWELSSGERSRVFLARGLLQRADVLILDESFASLDPETLRRCLVVARRRSQTLILMTHG